MTWGKYAQNCAARLARCTNLQQFQAVLRQIDQELEQESPPAGFDFWKKY
jgi:hypothetical protein